MENNEYDPQKALQDASDARTELSRRAVAPTYYYPVLGLALAVLVGSMAFATGPWQMIGIIFCVLASVVLLTQYENATGLKVEFNPSSGRGRWVWFVFMAVIILALIAASWVGIGDGPTWLGIVAIVGVFAATLLAGSVIEPILREDIAAGRVHVKAKK